MKEVWKEIIGFENRYDVSNLGRVRSKAITLNTNNQHSTCNRRIKGRILKQNFRGNYLRVCLAKSGTKKYVPVHRLVAKHFCNNNDNKPQVNHKDCNKLNNNASNLEWCTNSENQKHAFKNGRQVAKRGTDCWNSKLNEKRVRVIRWINIINPKLQQWKIAEIFKIPQQRVSKILRGETWAHIDMMQKLNNI